MDVQIGSKLLDRFVIEDKLGSGSYGNVFRALDLQDGSRVAVKISRRDDDDRTHERNIIEMKILNLLNESNSDLRRLVVKMKTNFVLDDCVILVLELLSRNLSSSISKESLSFSDISIYARQMVEFLCFMSQVGVIHGDIKPDNILHEPEGKGIKFCDFGLSHCSLVAEKAPFIQTLYYTAPEVVLGCDYDSSADTWSVGCVLFECLTKKQLFKVDSYSKLLEHVALIIGTPAQKVIKRAPCRDEYFTRDSESRLWYVNGLLEPVDPLGLKECLESCHDVNVNDPECLSFIDFIEGMLKVDPRERSSPEECLRHPFIASRRCRTTLKFDKITILGKICARMNLSNNFKRKTIRLFDRIKNDEALMGNNKMAVKTSCLYVVCRRKRFSMTIGQLAEVSGIDAKIIKCLVRNINEITKTKLMSSHTKRKTSVY